MRARTAWSRLTETAKLSVVSDQWSVDADAELIRSRNAGRGTTMLIVTSIYCAKLEPAYDATGKALERNIADLKDVHRNLVSVFQGTNRLHPIDGER